jgi:hypothetical protein
VNAALHVYVARHARARGVHAPGVAQAYCVPSDGVRCLGPHTGDWRQPPGSSANLHGIRPTLRRVALSEVLSRHYDYEAHYVAYAVTHGGDPLAQQPRVTMSSLPWLRSEGYEVVLCYLLADVDTPGHEVWTPEERRRFSEIWAACLGPFATAGVYLSPRGYRLIQPLLRPIAVEEARGRIARWLQDVVAAGAYPSATAVHDWTHLMRTPHHRRSSGEVIRASWMDLSRMRAIEAPAPVEGARTARPARRHASSVSVSIERWVEEVPEPWAAMVIRAGAAIASSVTDGRYRECYMALAGALAERGCPLEALPAALAGAHRVDRSYLGWEQLTDDRVRIAQGTVARVLAAQPVRGMRYLMARFPAVAAAMSECQLSDGFEPVAMYVPSSVSASVRVGESRVVVVASIDEADALASKFQVVTVAVWDRSAVRDCIEFIAGARPLDVTVALPSSPRWAGLGSAIVDEVRLLRIRVRLVRSRDGEISPVACVLCNDSDGAMR